MSTILTLHCSAGAGHRSVARAIDEALANGTGAEENGRTPGQPDRELPAPCREPEAALPHHLVADSLCFTGPPFRALCSRGYEFFARHMRWTCGVGYRLLDKPRSLPVRTVQKTSNMAVEGLAVFLEENEVDTVCCTHFLPMTLVGELRRKGRYHGRLHVCVTDYDIQGLWFEPEADSYYVATGKGAARLKDWGIPAERIRVTGIPVRHDFADLPAAAPRDADSRRALRVLFSAASLKTREALRLLREMAAPGLPLDVCVVTGRTPGLRKSLESYMPPPHMRLRVTGFEPHLERFMARSDLLVSKPGGITCSESLCAGLPMLFVFPIPMQEVHNARILEQAGAGVICFRPGCLARTLAELHENRKRLDAMRQACLALARPEAAAVVGAALLNRPDFRPLSAEAFPAEAAFRTE